MRCDRISFRNFKGTGFTTFFFFFAFLSHSCLQVIDWYLCTDISEGLSSFFFFFSFSFIVNIFHLFFALNSSAKEPWEKETYHGDEFTRSKNSQQHCRQSIMVVLQTIAFSTAPVMKNRGQTTEARWITVLRIKLGWSLFIWFTAL